MAKQLLLSSAESAAQGAKLAAVDSSPHYPQPFATEIIKKLEKLGGVDTFDLPTQSDAFNAAIGCALSGRRTFVATSFMSELADALRVVQMNLPIVAVDVSRASGQFKPERNLATFINAGWMVFVCESNQEIVDTIIRCYRICEDSKVMLPAVISIDHADFYEPLSLPSDQMIKNFLPKQLKKIDKRPSAYTPKDRDVKGSLDNAAKVYAKVNDTWKKKFKRSYDLSEPYMIDDADRILVTTGLHSATAKHTVNVLRKNGEKVGLLRIIGLRPFPEASVSSLSGKKVVVVDSSPLLYHEISQRIKCSSVILHSPNEKDFINVFRNMK